MKVSLIKSLFVSVASSIIIDKVAARNLDDSATFTVPKQGGKGELGGLSSGTEIKLIVKMKKEGGGAGVMNDVKKSKDIKVNTEVDIGSGEEIMGITVKQGDLEKLQHDPRFQNVEIDFDVYVLKKPVRLRQLAETTPWGIPKVLQDMEFWEDIADPTGAQMGVCVADTGYDIAHEDLPKEPNVDGTDNYGSSWKSDGHGHGSHCSGTVAAIGGNDKGVPGVIPSNKGGKFKLIIGKALSDSGSGSNSGVLAAVQHCINKGAKVVSMSLGCNSCYSQTNDDFYNSKYNDGILVIAAAGNSGNTVKSYPASYVAVMSVASLKENEQRSSFSQYNDQVEISAPGSDVLSTIPVSRGGPYASWSGTSMATPHVAAVAGLVWMYFPSCTNVEIRHVLTATAKDLGPTGCEEEYGYGMVQAKTAYDLLNEGNCGGNIGPTDPKGGCEELHGTPAPTPAPCTADSDCDDGISCTADSCNVSTGTCSHTAIATGTVEVSVTTDTYYTETSWDIVSGSDASNKLMSGGDYTAADTTYTQSEDLLACGEEYKFTIKDSYGDGMCCNYGQGGYIVKVDDEVVAEGGEFTAEETKTFSIGTDTPVTSPTSSPVTQPTSPITPSPVTSPTSSPVLTEMLDLVNTERRKVAGLIDLCYNDKLINAAQIHSDDMASRSQLSHTGGDGSSPFERIDREGFSWNSAAENVAMGYTTPQSVMAGWMNSNGHRANILGASSKYFGVGLAYSSNNTPYWTQVFAGSNSESCSTTSPVTSPTSSPVTSPTSSYSYSYGPTTSPTKAPTKAPTSSPTISCILCDDVETNNMIKKGKDCATFNRLQQKCNKINKWMQNKFCQLSCYNAGVGYDGDVCCNGATS